MRTTKEVVDLIKVSEGFMPKAYIDPVGVWTIGYGTTAEAGIGIVPKAGMVVTEWQASQYLEKVIEKVEADINRYVKVPLTDNQFSALVSFVYNVGIGNFASSTLLRKLNSRDYLGAANELLRWNKGTVRGQKVVLPGLVTRRAKEREVFLKGDKYVASLPQPKPVVQTKPAPSTPPSTEDYAPFWNWLRGIFGNG